MLILSLIMLMVASSIFFAGRRKYRYNFAPIRVYALLWGVVLALYFSNPCGYASPSPGTIILLLFSYAAFCTGCLYVKVVYKPRLDRRAIYVETVNEDRLRKLILFLALLGLFGSCLYVVLVIQKFGFYALFIEPQSIRTATFNYEGDEAIISGRLLLLMEWLQTCTYSAAVLGALHQLFLRKRYLPAYIPIVSIVIYDLAYVGRINTLLVVVIYLWGYLIGKRMRQKGAKDSYNKAGKTVVILAIIIMTAKMLLTSIVMDKFNVSNSSLWGYEVPGSVFQICFDLSAPIAGFDYIVTNGIQYSESYSVHVFFPIAMYFHRFVYSILGMDDPILMRSLAAMGDYQDFMPVSDLRSVNALFTYLRSFYDDFGQLGLVVGAFLFGFVAMFIYDKTLYTKRLVYFSLLIVVLLAITSSIWWWEFTEIPIFNTLFVLIICSWFLKRRFSFLPKGHGLVLKIKLFTHNKV